ncbi:MAG: 4-hydroxy-tetrahydrodipicolinate reductase [Chitinophagales bacterium]|nr:4-hydroxy-tetrahydrodipicolinate reductase [Chitinophagales bacterium]MCZ2393358.1 4-hydroxy-tetrahydrodipicolinate reductase [Chitinophagales bacterium]
MKIALIGYGKMGKAIEAIALEKNKKAGKDIFEIVLKIDIDNRHLISTEELSQVDVAIEFTSPHTAIENIHWCFEADVPVVVGSTGWTKELSNIQQYAAENNKSFLFAPNYSIGVNIFFEINRQLAIIMNDYEDYNVDLLEIHHTEKIDAPSGTALFAALDIINRVKRKDQWRNYKSDNQGTLSIISERNRDVPGTHVVRYTSPIDDIEIKHVAHNRTGFAAGALLAAEWIIGKKGYYSMEDVLGFNQEEK